MDTLPPGSESRINDIEVVIFDFDKTITTIDTFTALIVYLIKASFWRQCLAILVLPFISLMNAFCISKRCAVSLGLWVASIGMKKRELIKYIHQFAKQDNLYRKNPVVRPQAITSINRHLSEGHRVVIASASSKLWIRHFLGPELSSQVTIIGSRLEIRWYGLALKSWCFGKDKIVHISEIKLHQTLRTIYTDCLSDLSLVKLAKKGCFINLPGKEKKILAAEKNYYFLEWN